MEFTFPASPATRHASVLGVRVTAILFRLRRSITDIKCPLPVVLYARMGSVGDDHYTEVKTVCVGLS
jgi:hypothetical protein